MNYHVLGRLENSTKTRMTRSYPRTGAERRGPRGTERIRKGERKYAAMIQKARVLDLGHKGAALPWASAHKGDWLRLGS
jgi:hypothetical protein